MRLATWNVNSIRARVERVLAFLERHDVDVLAVQETKAKDEKFPYEAFADSGYEIAHHGINQWNGVAIFSRVGLTDVRRGFAGMPQWGEPAHEEARALGARCGGVDVWSLYIPNGRALDDPHMAYKLTWMKALAQQAHDWAADGAQVALCGDFNVAPFDEDVWDPEFFEGLTHTSTPERDAFFAFQRAGFTDVVRERCPGPGVYTYWDYQQLRFPKKQGMRIDFILGSSALAERVNGARIDREERKGKGASDHAPVIVDLDPHPASRSPRAEERA